MGYHRLGIPGEDIASLIADEADITHMAENYERCIKAYYKGFSEYVDISHIKSFHVKELILSCTATGWWNGTICQNSGAKSPADCHSSADL